MTISEIINTLKMNMELIKINPFTGEEVEIECMHELDRRSYLAFEQAIDILQKVEDTRD